MTLLAQVLSDADQQRFWSKVALPDANGCMLWLDAPTPFGYSRFWLNRRSVPGHRLSLALATGVAPDGREGAHSCGIRHCVAPDHLRWATPTENAADKIAHGTEPAGERNPFAKLTGEQVVEIRAKFAGGGYTYDSLSAAYGVLPQNIMSIVRRKSWKSAPGEKPPALPNHWGARTHCGNGHEYTEENTETNAKGWRRCKICRRVITDAYRARWLAFIWDIAFWFFVVSVFVLPVVFAYWRAHEKADAKQTTAALKRCKADTTNLHIFDGA